MRRVEQSGIGIGHYVKIGYGLVFRLIIFRRVGSQDLLAQRNAADEFVRYCNNWV